MMDKYHPGYFGKVSAGAVDLADDMNHLIWADNSASPGVSGLQVGMRHFNIRKNQYFQPIINLDKLWSLLGNEVQPLLLACSLAPNHGLVPPPPEYLFMRMHSSSCCCRFEGITIRFQPGENHCEHALHVAGHALATAEHPALCLIRRGRMPRRTPAARR